MSVGLGQLEHLIKYCEVFSHFAGENVKRENGNCYLNFETYFSSSVLDV